MYWIRNNNSKWIGKKTILSMQIRKFNYNYLVERQKEMCDSRLLFHVELDDQKGIKICD